jgi:hypothetical protein
MTMGTVRQPRSTSVRSRTVTAVRAAAAFNRSPSELVIERNGIAGIRAALSVVGVPQMVVTMSSCSVSVASI